MGQGYSAALPPGPSAIEAAELSDLTFEKPLGGARFIRTVRARHQHGVVVVKVCMKANANVSFRQYSKLLRQERQTLRGVPNVLRYQKIRETSTLGLLVRQFIHTSLYDRISIRPFLESIEKKWIAFQLLCAVRDCHARGVFHGDIKSENVLVTSWGWVYLTDFAATFKPVYLPEDNPADFSYYYDTSARRTCYIAPERFLAPGQETSEGDVVQWNMDIFSLGCVIAELFTETPTFTLSQLFKYRRGEYDPTVSLLNKVDDEHIRALIGSMIRLNPEERWHAQDYLDEYRAKAFPLYFYQHLHTLMQEITEPTSGGSIGSSNDGNNGICDDRIDRIYNDFEILSVSLGYPLATKTPPSAGLTRGLFPLQIDLPNNRHTADTTLGATSDNGTFVLLNVITSSMRSVGRGGSKVRACELLLAFAERLPDEAKLDHILPYIMPLLDDTDPTVLVAALRTMTQLLALVTVTSPVNSFLFTQYIFPRLQSFVNTKGFKSNAIVRATYAACLASLAETALRFLDMMQALRADGSLPPGDRGAEGDMDGVAGDQDAYDETRRDMLEAFEGQTKVFLTDSDNSVRRAFLSSVTSLCVFFGEVRASDVILSHLNTYLNDTDWLLKCAFFKTIVGVAVYIGGASLEEFILPLMMQALADPQEFVVEQALRSLASMAEIGLLQRSKTWELIDTVARFEMHPNLWIKEAASHFISAATTYLSIADVRILVMPLVEPYLKVPVGALTETDLLDALKKPLPRAVLDMALEWAKRVDRGVFWKSAMEAKQLSYRAVSQMPPSSSVAHLGPRSLGKVPKNDEDEQWLGRLRNTGMRGEDEMKILAFREYLWRAAQRAKRDVQTNPPILFDSIVSLSKLQVKPQTVIFDNDVALYEQRVQYLPENTIAQALSDAAGPRVPGALRRLSLTGVSDSPVITEHLGSPMSGVEIKKQPATQNDRFSGLRGQTSGSMSSSPSSGIGMLTKDSERIIPQRGNATALLGGGDGRNKALAAVATDDAVAAGRLNTPTVASRRNSPTSRSGQESQAGKKPASNRGVHNYTGNDPTVLKLLDAVYVDNFSVDAAEFGPIIQPAKRGPIPSTGTVATTESWRPQCQLVAVLAEHTARIIRILISPDHAFFLTASDDGSVKVWDSARLERNVTHRSRQTYNVPPGVKVTSLCFIDSTHTFVCTGSDGSVHIVKVDVAESANTARYGRLRLLREWQIPSSGTVTEHAVWSEHYRGDSASTLILATSFGRILAVDLRLMSIIFDFHNPAQHGSLTCFCIGRRRDWLLVGTSQGVLDLWDLRFCVRLRSWTFRHAVPITGLQVHPSRKAAKRNRVCVSGGTARGEVTVWDIEKLICHEIYKPAHYGANDQLNLRDYELRSLEEDRPELPLSRVAGSLAAEESAPSSGMSAPSVTTAMHFSAHTNTKDSNNPDTFVVTGGPDGKVRFWDSDRSEGCRLVSGDGPGETKPTYMVSQLGLDTRVLSERASQTDLKTSSSNPLGSTSRQKMERLPSAASKPSRYEAIRTSAQHLMAGHLDTITDVALLERPFDHSPPKQDPDQSVSDHHIQALPSTKATMPNQGDKMSQTDSSRIQSSNVSMPSPPIVPPFTNTRSQAKSGNDPGFASRAQSAGDKNANSSNAGSAGNSAKGGNGSNQGKK